ncbi:protein Jade-1 [Chanos chanos]|uniref:Protein Jade-1 n=1 Tax=Chanos chanos TaxID=29144 RepID=A0A6J2WEG0_CHACN|nr:protein Jade-1-like [Chanos chanos]XP_030642719.1 protein Jade-1-like [Chanos chanos]
MTTMRRNRHPSSEDSDNGSTSTSWSQHSKNNNRRPGGPRPSEVFRTDLITAMKLHDSYQLSPDDYYILADPWRQEWEKGVQVPVSPHSIPEPTVRVVEEKSSAIMFTRPKKLIRSSGPEATVLGYVGVRTLAEGMCRYDLNEEDVSWLEIANKEFTKMAIPTLDEITMERVIEQFELQCYDNMSHAMETEEGLGIEYDEDVVCDVCQSPDGEDGNEMVFCDRCNICVHQACYGILNVPEGSWLCRICALGIVPRCQLCPKKGGAMKPTRSGNKWVHVSCALWIPEVSIGNPEKMEPITNVSHIPSHRWALVCCLCKEKMGACIQCSAKSCRTAFHVTCGLQCGLNMNTILTDTDEVKFKSFCPKHSGMDWNEDEDGMERLRMNREQTESGPLLSPGCLNRSINLPDGQKPSERKLRLQQMEEEFYRFVSVEEVAKHLGLPMETVDFLFQYWKLKRRTNFNQPLVKPKKEEEESLAKSEQEVLLRRLRLFTHLRQDLERVRNLTYMVTRREKIKRSVCRVQEQIFHHHIRLLEQGRLTGASTTRQLEESMFYFRSPPNSVSSPQPLRGHSGQNTDTVSLRLDREKSTSKRPAPKTQQLGDDTAKLPKTEALAPAKLPKVERLDLSPKPAPVGRRVSKRDDAPPVAVRTTECKEQRNVTGAETRKADDSASHVQEQNHDAEERSRKRGLREQLTVNSKLKLGSKITEETTRSQTEGSKMLDKLLLPDCRVSLTPISIVPTKYNGSVIRASTSQLSEKVVHNGASGAHLKNWGSFRIPKRSDRIAGGVEEGRGTAQETQSPPLKPLDRSPEATPPQLRARSRTGTENHSLTHETDISQSEPESRRKRCHTQRLRSHDPMTCSYGSDVIRHGVLAS